MYDDEKEEHLKDLWAERMILSGLLFKPQKMLDVQDTVSSEDFFNNDNSEIFDAILELHRDNAPVTAVSVLDQLRKKGEVTRSLQDLVFNYELDMGSGENLNHYAKIVKRFSMLRAIVCICESGASAATDGATDAEPLTDDLMSKLGGLAEHAASELLGVHTTLKDTYKEIVKRSEDPESVMGRKSGFSDLDSKTNGFRAGELIVLAARPAMGKSALALEIAKNSAAISNLPSIFFSLEMTRSSCEERLLSSIGMVPTARLRSGTLSSEHWTSLSEAANTLSKIPIAIDESASLTVWDVKRKARAYKHKHGLGMILIDYLQLMRGNNKDNREREVAEISRQLKMLAKELEVPIVALSQLNRGLESRNSKVPMLSDLRESGAIEQDCDVAIFLHRSKYYEDQESVDENNSGSEFSATDTEEAQLFIRKNRHGSTGEIKLAWQPTFCRFKNYEERTSFVNSSAIKAAAGWQ